MISTGSIEELIVTEVAAVGYSPRSSKHSDAQSLVIIRDLLETCPVLAQRASSGEVVAKLKHQQRVGHSDWVIDIAVGTAPGAPLKPEVGELIRLTEPAIIQVAIELKSIWTEHGKARKNRLRDFNAFHAHARQYNAKTIAAAFLVVNASECFLSPLNLGKAGRDPITRHSSKGRTAHQVAKDAIDIFRSIHLRNSLNDPDGLEALGVVVIEHDNLVLLDGKPEYASIAERYASIRKPSRVAGVAPGLKVGDPLHYSTMLQRICNAYRERF